MTAIATLWQTHEVSKVIWQSHNEIFRFFVVVEKSVKPCLCRSNLLTWEHIKDVQNGAKLSPCVTSPNMLVYKLFSFKSYRIENSNLVLMLFALSQSQKDKKSEHLDNLASGNQSLHIFGFRAGLILHHFKTDLVT